VFEALVETSGRAQAADILGLSAGLVGELELNRRLSEIAARPAGTIYTGVLYDALDLSGLSPLGKRRARTIRVQSALWGPITVGDRIPPYRLSIGTSLPGIGPLASFWRRELAGSSLDREAAGELIIDCRSSGYAGAWQPPTEKLIKVNAYTEKDGKPVVVSHFAKHARGLVARLLLEADRLPRSPERVAEVVNAHSRCELSRTRQGWELGVLTDPLGGLRPPPAS
jgi:cytoplasmic iron level regulating protein YaaA (DUF328/UPF0246 family)